MFDKKNLLIIFTSAVILFSILFSIYLLFFRTSGLKGDWVSMETSSGESYSVSISSNEFMFTVTSVKDDINVNIDFKFKYKILNTSESGSEEKLIYLLETSKFEITKFEFNASKVEELFAISPENFEKSLRDYLKDQFLTDDMQVEINENKDKISIKVDSGEPLEFDKK